MNAVHSDVQITKWDDRCPEEQALKLSSLQRLPMDHLASYTTCFISHILLVSTPPVSLDSAIFTLPAGTQVPSTLLMDRVSLALAARSRPQFACRSNGICVDEGKADLNSPRPPIETARSTSSDRVVQRWYRKEMALMHFDGKYRNLEA